MNPIRNPKRAFLGENPRKPVMTELERRIEKYRAGK